MSVFFFVLLLAVRIVAQSSNVTCLPGFSWAINSRNQTPCLVAAYLESACNPGQPITIPPLPANNHYLGPPSSQADPCSCNVVVYSLVSACGACQDREFRNWANWTLNCFQSDNKTFPKPTPAAVEIPGWAFLDLSKTNWTFNVQAASLAAAEEATSTSTTTSTQPGTTSSAGDNVPSTTGAQPSESVTDGETSHAGAIAGGVVGGIAGIALIALAIFWLFLKRDGGWNNRRRTQQRIDLDAEGLQPSSLSDTTRGHTATHSMSTVPGALGPLSNNSLLEPQSTGDIFTPITSPMYTTMSLRNSLESLPFTGSQVTRGAYSGVAEL